jgi:protease-4
MRKIHHLGGTMKKIRIWLVFLPFIFSSCAAHFHLDFLGKDKIEEVVLIKSPVKEKVLLLDISGVISSSSNRGILEREGDVISYVYYRLKKASEDSLIKGVILRLDTPGGEVTASDIIYHEILNFKKRTGIPVLALMMSVAASGGYYIASACDQLMAHPSSLTGSIGVISIFPNLDGLMDKTGIQVQIIKSGKLKDSGSPFRKMTEEEKKIFQDIIDEYYQNFLQAVYENRKDYITLENLNKLADGRIFTASQALKARLIDEIGYFDTALEKVLELSSLREANVVTYTYYPKQKTNIYAMQLKGPSPFEGESIKEMIQPLKSGFYYLWHPQLFD